jgi:hypothetical protein
MTYYAALTYKDITSGSPTAKSYQTTADYITVSPTGMQFFRSTGTAFNPLIYGSNNTILPSTTSSYTGDYANYVIVNNDTNNWVITLPLGPGGGTNVWSSRSFHLTIKKTGSGTLTIQTPADTIGNRIRGINTLSNKSYTLSQGVEQSITFLYTYGITHTGTTDSTAEIWQVIS